MTWMLACHSQVGLKEAPEVNLSGLNAPNDYEELHLHRHGVKEDISDCRFG